MQIMTGSIDALVADDSLTDAEFRLGCYLLRGYLYQVVGGPVGQRPAELARKLGQPGQGGKDSLRGLKQRGWVRDFQQATCRWCEEPVWKAPGPLGVFGAEPIDSDGALPEHLHGVDRL